MKMLVLGYEGCNSSPLPWDPLYSLPSYLAVGLDKYKDPGQGTKLLQRPLLIKFSVKLFQHSIERNSTKDITVKLTHYNTKTFFNKKVTKDGAKATLKVFFMQMANWLYNNLTPKKSKYFDKVGIVVFCWKLHFLP